MKGFWVALVFSILLCIFVILRVDNFSGFDYFCIFVFFYCSLYVLLEISKWPQGKRIVDNTKGIARYIFGEQDQSFWKKPYFSPRASIINVRGEGAYNVRRSFIESLVFLAVSLCWLFRVG
jgi:hypothetical protein